MYLAGIKSMNVKKRDQKVLELSERSKEVRKEILRGLIRSLYDLDKAS